MSEKQDIDVVICYSRKEIASRDLFVSALTQLGAKVWWDIELHPVEAHGNIVMRKIKAAHSVVVLWTLNSVKSGYVEKEAIAALKRQKMLSVVLDVPEIGNIEGIFESTEFIGINHFDLSHWGGDVSDPAFGQFFCGILKTLSHERNEVLAKERARALFLAARDQRVPLEWFPVGMRERIGCHGEIETNIAREEAKAELVSTAASQLQRVEPPDGTTTPGLSSTRQKAVASPDPSDGSKRRALPLGRSLSGAAIAIGAIAAALLLFVDRSPQVTPPTSTPTSVPGLQQWPRDDTLMVQNERRDDRARSVGQMPQVPTSAGVSAGSSGSPQREPSSEPFPATTLAGNVTPGQFFGDAGRPLDPALPGAGRDPAARGESRRTAVGSGPRTNQPPNEQGDPATAPPPPPAAVAPETPQPSEQRPTTVPLPDVSRPPVVTVLPAPSAVFSTDLERLFRRRVPLNALVSIGPSADPLILLEQRSLEGLQVEFLSSTSRFDAVDCVLRSGRWTSPRCGWSIEEGGTRLRVIGSVPNTPHQISIAISGGSEPYPTEIQFGALRMSGTTTPR